MEKLLHDKDRTILEKIALTIRGLSMDGVQKANSGHPGLPMGCAELGAYLFTHVLNYNPKNPQWINRDRLILSAGHGSMWLYSLLFLSGYALSIEDLKKFRQLHSKTPGHPESRETEGVETTTGPLGQGVGNAVGTALGLKMLEARFNTLEHPLFSAKVYTLMGDGCMMEGISSEASSLAGHLCLDNLVIIYDSNHVSLDGPLKESASEDTKKRYEAYGFQVFEIDGNNFNQIHDTFVQLQGKQKKPTLVIAHTIIGKGSPHKQGTYKAHGSPLGEEEVRETKKCLGLPLEPTFFVSDEVAAYFKEALPKRESAEKEWQILYAKWRKSYPEKASLFDQMSSVTIPLHLEEKLHALPIKTPAAGRKYSHELLQEIAKEVPSLIGGSADLSCSDLTMLKSYPIIESGHFEGRNIKFGVREFAMAASATGLCQTRMFIPFIGTFLTFSDYMRNAIRLASLMKEHVIYQFTHDSIFLGEDGPTHQPIEHLAALRAMPHLHVIRPADIHETRGAWLSALTYKGPTALILSRQPMADFVGTDLPFREGVGRGAYILEKEEGKPDVTLMATGSEMGLARDVAKSLREKNKRVRLISFPCFELFEEQPLEYQETILGGDIGVRVSIEAASSFGWHKYVGREGITIAIDTFGTSAPYKDLIKTYGFTVESILQKIPL